MTTIGGVVFRFLDRLPKVGDRVALDDGIVATVLEMDGHRLARVRVAKGTLGEEEESEGEAPAQPEGSLETADAEVEQAAATSKKKADVPRKSKRRSRKRARSADVVDLSVVKESEARRDPTPDQPSDGPAEVQDGERG